MRALLAVGNVPEEIIEAIRLARLTALSKPDGGVDRGGRHREEVGRPKSPKKSKMLQLPSSTPSEQKQGVSACLADPHRFKPGPETTIVSIDGVGGVRSRNALLEGLLRMEDGDQILPFVRHVLRLPAHIFVGG